MALTRGIQVTDVVTDIGDGVLLINLLEVLSEREFPDKYNRAAKLRVHKIDNVNKALSFTWSCGVDIKVKPSAEGTRPSLSLSLSLSNNGNGNRWLTPLIEWLSCCTCRSRRWRRDPSAWSHLGHYAQVPQVRR